MYTYRCSRTLRKIMHWWREGCRVSARIRQQLPRHLWWAHCSPPTSRTRLEMPLQHLRTLFVPFAGRPCESPHFRARSHQDPLRPKHLAQDAPKNHGAYVLTTSPLHNLPVELQCHIIDIMVLSSLGPPNRLCWDFNKLLDLRRVSCTLTPGKQKPMNLRRGKAHGRPKSPSPCAATPPLRTCRAHCGRGVAC
jgi:hypothetical protein